MFGFLGKAEIKINTTTNGESVVSRRRFQFAHAGHVANVPFRAYFDMDDVSGTEPNFKMFASEAEETNDSLPIGRLSTEQDAIQADSLTGYTFLQLAKAGQFRGWRYTSTSALSPATRTYRVIFNRPELVHTIAWSTAQNNVGKTDTNNAIKGVVSLALDAFQNLYHFSLIEGYVSSLTFTVGNKLRSFTVFENPTLATISGKLPASCKYVRIGTSLVSSISTLIQDCNLETLILGRFGGAVGSLPDSLTTLTGTLDLSTKENLKELGIAFSTGLTTLSLPTGKSDWRLVHIQSQSNAQATMSTTALGEMIASSTIFSFVFINNNKTWSKSFGNSDIPVSLNYLHLFGNQITGNFIVTDPRTNLKEIKLGALASEGNTIATIDLTGLDSGSTTALQLNGLSCSNLTLPTSLPSLTSFEAFDNALDITTNSDLITKLNGYTALTQLWLSQNNNSNLVAGFTGQSSTNGLGANPTLSALVNLTVLILGDCKITGTLTLPNVNKLIALNVGFNSGLTSIANLTAHTSIQAIRANSCTSLAISIGTTFTALNDIHLCNTLLSTIDLTGKTTTTQITAIFLDGSTVTSITMPNVAGRANFANSHRFSAVGCTSLTSINNLEYVNMRVQAAVNYNFTFNGCTSLNQTIPFGTSDFCPSTIDLSDCSNMSQANLDASIMGIHSNRTKWDFFSHSIRVLNIGGTTVAPGGTYQAPTVAGSPASAKEAIHELVNLKGWTITFN